MQKYINDNRYFAWLEFLVSKKYPDLARDVELTPRRQDFIAYWVERCGDPWRLSHPDNAVIITSGIRSEALNLAVKGSIGSDHVYGFAVDSKAVGMKAPQYFCSILEMDLPYRQLILYLKKKFVHWSINVPGCSYKHEVRIM